MKEPTLAVVVAVRNGARHLPRAIASVLAQSRAPDELVLVDDGSTDGTTALVRDAAAASSPYPIRAVVLPPSGISKARNAGNAVCTSDIIVVLDADDELLPTALADYQVFAKGGADLIYADCIVVAGPVRRQNRYRAFASSGAMLWSLATSFIVPFKHSAMCYRRDAFRRIGGYDEALPRKVDVDLVARFLVAGLRCAYLAKATCLHHKHRGQMSVARLRGLTQWKIIIDRSIVGRPLKRAAALALRVFAESVKWVLRA